MKIDWNEAELNMLKGFDISFDVKKDLTDDELSELYDIIPDYLLEFGVDIATSESELCEDILTKTAIEMDARVGGSWINRRPAMAKPRDHIILPTLRE